MARRCANAPEQSGVGKKARQHFFFEKKKQKTFANFPPGDVPPSRVKVIKVFCGGGPPGHFFQKSDRFALLLLFALGGLAPAAAESTSLYPAFGGFALRVPDAPHAAMAAQIYSQTGPSPTWLVSQWNIAGPWLAPFSFSSNAEG